MLIELGPQIADLGGEGGKLRQQGQQHGPHGCGGGVPIGGSNVGWWELAHADSMPDDRAAVNVPTG